jgi:chromosome segregation ATPase
LEQRAQAALAANRELISRLESEITSQLDQIAAALREQTADEPKDAAELERAQAEVHRLQAELENSRAVWAAERAALEAARNQSAEQAARLEAEQRATKDQWQRQLAEFEEKLSQQQAAWNEQRSAWTQEREGLQRERDELRQKFELALEDVQRLRSRVAELEQELARRPQTNEADSAELVALRAERGALSERIEQLERQPPADTSADQQLADLQRRFELAVEDVRELKTKNAGLQAQLASAFKGPAPAADNAGMDWESQKRRLLASLEDHGVERQPLPHKDRLTIESTIEMTDAIVAEKDKEIADLHARLDGGAQSSLAEAERERKIAELVDADEVIAQHRKRVAELEREVEEKLRAAELELSVERAKIARHKAELEDLRAELDAQRNALGADDANTAGGPRRRWLSKLGLSGEEP